MGFRGRIMVDFRRVMHPTVPCFRKKGQHFQNKQSRNICNVITLGSSVLTKQTTQTNHSGVRLLSWVEHLLKNDQSFAHSTARSCSAAGGTSIGNFAIFGFSFFFRRPFQIASHQRRRYKRKREKQKRL